MNTLKTVAVKIIEFYQRYISPDTGMFSFKRGTTCVFYPTCSEYTKQAIVKYGITRGVFLGTKRILRCHPWQNNHIDPLP